jgi:hypothetical protein
VLWEAIPSALAASFSPTTLLMVTGLLALSRPILHATVFLGSAAVVTVGVGLLVVFGLQGLGLDGTREHPTAPPVLDLVLGLLILASAAYVARRPRHAPKQKPEARDMRLLVVVGLGLFTGSPSPLYLASLHSLAKGHPGPAASVVYVLLLAAIVQLMAELPLVLYLAQPDRAVAALNTMNAWLARHGRTVALTAAVVVGTYFVINGIVRLIA